MYARLLLCRVTRWDPLHALLRLTPCHSVTEQNSGCWTITNCRPTTLTSPSPISNTAGKKSRHGFPMLHTQAPRPSQRTLWVAHVVMAMLSIPSCAALQVSHEFVAPGRQWVACCMAARQTSAAACELLDLSVVLAQPFNPYKHC
jgi:hypothetical protein